MTVDYSTYKCIKVEVEDGVAIATMNRPEVLNAINEALLQELHSIFPDLARDDDVKAIIITGAGRGFCAGADLKGMSSRKEGTGTAGTARIASYLGHKEVAEEILDIEKPVIAAVNGPAAGLGVTIALYCDIIIAADTARFGDTHIRVGLVPGDGGTIMWPLLIGPARAKELLMTGDMIDAKEADRIGLVNRVVPLDKLMPTAKELARRLAHGPTLAIGWTKRSINKRIKQDWNLLLDGVLGSEMISMTTEDNREGARAFVEKRPPQYKGR